MAGAGIVASIVRGLVVWDLEPSKIVPTNVKYEDGWDRHRDSALTVGSTSYEVW